MIEIIENHFSEIIVICFSFFTIIFTYVYQLKRDRINRLDEHRKIAYEKMVNIFMNILREAFKVKASEEKETFGEKRFENLKNLIIYSSYTVMSKYKQIDFILHQVVDGSIKPKKKDALQVFYLVEECIIEIRKELNPKERLERGDILSLVKHNWKEKVENQYN